MDRFTMVLGVWCGLVFLLLMGWLIFIAFATNFWFGLLIVLFFGSLGAAWIIDEIKGDV